MADDVFYTYQESRKVTLPSASTALAIEKREWERLKKTVNTCKTENQWFMSIAFCFLGIAGSAFVTWLSLLSQEKLVTIRLVLIITVIVSIVLGLICVAFQLYINKNHRTTITSIKEEIQYIEDGIRKEDVS